MEDDDDFGPPLRGSSGGSDGRQDGPDSRDRGGDASDDDWGPAARGGGSPPPTASAAAEGRAGGGDGFGPASSGRARARLPRLPLPGIRVPRVGGLLPRPGTVVLAVVTLFAVVAVGGLGLLAYATAAMPRTDVTGLQRPGGGRTNVLLVGTDSRDGLTDEELQALGTEAVDGQRTDSILLLSVRGGAAAILAFPRDLLAERCDGSQGRVNAAYAVGGPGCLADTVTRTSGIPVSHYLEVDFLGFTRIVDAVGGVPVFLDAPMTDVAAGVELPAGCVTLDGASALGFVRARTVDGDLGRVARQQRFVAELADEVLSPSTLLNPVRLASTVARATRAVTADRGLGPVDLLRLARAGRGLARGGLATYTVPTVSQTVGGAAVQVATPDADALYGQFRDGSVLEVEAAAPEPPGDEAPPADPQPAPGPEVAPGPADPGAAGVAEPPADC